MVIVETPVGSGQADSGAMTAASASVNQDLVEAPGPAAVAPPGPAGAVMPYALALAALVITYWCVDIVWPALPELRDDLAFSATEAGLFSTLFFGGRLLANIPAAVLVERIGAVWTGAAGGGLLLTGSALATIATGATTIYPARALQGAGVALLVTAALLSVLRARPGRGAAMTAFNLTAGIGGAAGLLSGGYLTGAGSWRWVFGLCVVLAGIAMGGAILARGTRSATPAIGATTSTAVSTSGMDEGGRSPGTAFLANLLVFVNYSVFVVSLPLYAAERFDASASSIAALLLVLNMVHLAGAWPAGRIIRRQGASRSLTVSFGLTAAALAVVILAPSALWLLGPLALYALGQVGGSSAAGDLLLRAGTSGGRGGRAVGMVRLSSDVGLAGGPLAVGALADLAGVEATFIALAAVTALAACLSGGRLPNPARGFMKHGP